MADLAEPQVPVRIVAHDVVREVRAIGTQHRDLIVKAALVVGGLQLAMELAGAGSADFWITVGIVVFGQYHFLARLLDDRIDRGEPRDLAGYAAIVVSGLLSFIPIVWGLSLLIAPGAFLLARWSAANPLIVAERRSGLAALRESWRISAASSGPLFVVYLGLAVLMLFTLGATTLSPLFAFDRGGSLPSRALGDLAATVVLVGSWVLSAAIYRLLRPGRAVLEGVFA